MLELEDVIEDDTGEVVGGDGGLVDAALDIVHDRRPLGGAASVPAIKITNEIRIFGASIY